MIRPNPLVLDDVDGSGLPAPLTGAAVIDAHVHLFPDAVFDAVWRWFDQHAWPVRHRLHSDGVLDFLESRGVTKVVALHYSHKPGMAAALNEYVLAIAKRRPIAIPTATVLPGEPGDREILRRALGDGCRGIKIHCHVQKLAVDDPRMNVPFEEAARADVPLVIHCGREPSSDAYGIDARELCGVDATARMLERHPETTVVVPHIGSDEFAEYEALLDRYPRLWLDTTMTLGGYFPKGPDLGILARRSSRLLYGTDFPNLPYAWDRELKVLAGFGLAKDALTAIASGNAEKLFCATSP